MLVIKGKYNIAKVMLPDDSYLEEETRKQIYSFLNHPAFKGDPIVIMPDTHAGKGSVIGFTMKMNEYVIPNVVGVDLGCGMLAVKLPEVDINFQKFDDFIKENIPSGFSADTDKGLKSSVFKLYSNKYLDVYKRLSEKVGQTASVLHSLGTLGGGNHFIEVNESSDGDRWVVIHSGSRNLGLKVCEYHQKIAKKLMNDMFIGDAYKNQEYLPLEHGGNDYITDMRIAQQYAMDNRFVMMYKIIKDFFGFNLLKFDLDNVVECTHNYINPVDNIVRKGAISAREGEKVIIPLNMRDGTIFGIGKGNKDWNYSAPHGAGRILSRKRAKENLILEDVKESMKDVWTSSVKASTLDEAPQAYKDSQLIIDTIKDTVEITQVMKPIYNFKSSN